MKKYNLIVLFTTGTIFIIDVLISFWLGIRILLDDSGQAISSFPAIIFITDIILLFIGESLIIFHWLKSRNLFIKKWFLITSFLLLILPLGSNYAINYWQNEKLNTYVQWVKIHCHKTADEENYLWIDYSCDDNYNITFSDPIIIKKLLSK